MARHERVECYRYGVIGKVGAFLSPEQPQLTQLRSYDRTLTQVPVGKRDSDADSK